MEKYYCSLELEQYGISNEPEEKCGRRKDNQRICLRCHPHA